MKKLIILVVILLLFCITTFSFTLVKQSYRSNTYTLNTYLINKINYEAHGMDEMEVLNYSIRLTSDYLQFATNNNIDKGRANCVGYAQLCSSICNYALKLNHLHGYAKPVVGYVKYNKFNICGLLVACAPNTKWKLFVKDHDFVEFYFGNDLIYADPCAYDLLGTDCKTFKSRGSSRGSSSGS